VVVLGLLLAWLTWEGPPPRIRVRWSPNLADEVRQRDERALDLELVGPTDPDTYEYQLWSPYPADIAALVHHPDVADTSGIDREQFRLDRTAVGNGTGRVWRGGFLRGRQSARQFRVVFGVLLGITFLSGLLAHRTRPTRR